MASDNDKDLFECLVAFDSQRTDFANLLAKGEMHDFLVEMGWGDEEITSPPSVAPDALSNSLQLPQKRSLPQADSQARRRRRLA